MPAPRFSVGWDESAASNVLGVGMDAARRHSAAEAAGATLWDVTTREKAHRLLDQLPESEVEPVVEFIASRRRETTAAAPRQARRPRLGLGRSSDGLSAAETASEPVAIGVPEAWKTFEDGTPQPDWTALIREDRDRGH